MRSGAGNPDELLAIRAGKGQSQVADERHVAAGAEAGARRTYAAVAHFKTRHAEWTARVGTRDGAGGTAGCGNRERRGNPLPRLMAPLEEAVEWGVRRILSHI